MIEIVGYASGNSENSESITLSLTTLTGGIGSSAQEGDVVVVAYAQGSFSLSDVNLTMATAGYTEIADLYSNDTSEAQLYVGYKVMGATPDTTAVTTDNGTSTVSNAALAVVLRGVDTTVTTDVTSTTATGTNGLYVDPPSITPTTSGALILAFGGSSMKSYQVGQKYTGFGNMTEVVSVAGIAESSALGTVAAAKKEWTSGAFNPSTWSGPDSGSGEAWAGVTTAFRPLPDAATVQFRRRALLAR